MRVETFEVVCLYELRHGEAISQVELAGRLDVSQGAISKLERSEDVLPRSVRWAADAVRVVSYRSGTSPGHPDHQNRPERHTRPTTPDVSLG